MDDRIEERIKKRVTDWGDAVIRATGGGEPEIGPSLLKKPPLKLVGEDGNAFAILGRAFRAAREAGWCRFRFEQYKAKATSGDYDNLLAVTMEYFDVR